VRLAWVLLLAAGCVRSATVDCGDGTVCASEQLCVHASPEVTVCAPPGAREACAGAGIADGETCDDGMGRCYDGACLPIECGDRLVDPDLEQCDDGNNQPGDLCSGDCRSTERCGNGVVDPVAGEICDDGNLVGHDGCSGACTIESPRWTPVQVGTPPINVALGIDYLPVRGRVVGLFDTGSQRSTWQFDGTGWQQVVTSVSPTGRSEFGAVADPVRDVLVVIGGLAAAQLNGSLSDLWELDRERWTIVSGALRGRASPAVAYDTRRKRVMMFGGRNDGTVVQPLDDLVEWDGTTATSVGPQTGAPPARWGAAMVYDPRRDELLLFGGAHPGGLHADTWTFRAGTWTPHPVSGPAPRSDARMIVDAIGVVLYGGRDAAKSLDDAWRWNGTGWMPLGAQTPGPRARHGFAYDAARRRAVLFSGSTTVGSAWVWDGVSPWETTGTSTAIVGELAATAFDPLRHQGLVVTPSSTLVMRDGSWKQLAASPVPNRANPALTFDTARDRAVLFGGVSSAGPILAETMVLTPGPAPAWTRLATATSPPARSGTALVFDSDRGVAVMFGGNNGATAIGDTWELDTDWRPRTGGTAPSARAHHAMAYDPVRKRTILFGGTDFGRVLGDLWSWDGTAWTELRPPGRVPVARSNATLTWNPGRRRLTLIGGTTDTIGVIDDAWEWAGDRWEEIDAPSTPGARGAHIAVPASDRSGLYVAGGTDGIRVLADQWLLSWSESDRIYERCLARQDLDGDGAYGCDDPDCWWACTPLCTPTLPCPTSAPRCGDGVVGPAETCQLCAADLTPCPMCGDLACEAPETAATCPGDCP